MLLQLLLLFESSAINGHKNKRMQQACVKSVTIRSKDPGEHTTLMILH